MNKETLNGLSRCRTLLVDRLDVNDVLDDLRCDNHFTLDDSQLILHEATDKRKVGKLLDILEGKSQETFDLFLQIIEKLPHFEDVVEYLKKEITQLSVKSAPQNVNRVLKQAGVPLQPQNYIERLNHVAGIRTRLRNAAESNCWLLIWGMPGQGKTVLAAESLRCPDILQLYPGGIFWITVGEKLSQLELCKNLATQLNSGHKKLSTQGQALSQIRDWTCKSARSLVVLDDVWDASTSAVLDCLDNVIITSRDSDVIDDYESVKYKIEIGSGFTAAESASAFSLWMGISVDELPQQAELLHEKCHGLPLVISNIAAHLRENPTHWDFYADLLKTGQLKEIKKKGSRYPHRNVFDAINISVTHLEESLMSIIQYFIVFESDVFLSTEIFSIILGKRPELIERDLSRLYAYSLVIKRWSKELKEFVYGVHDLIHDFLKEYTENNVKVLYRTVALKYADLCRHRWWELKAKDKTIWWFLGYYIREADLHDLVNELYLDLRGLEIAMRNTDFYHVIEEINLCIEKFEKLNNACTWSAYLAFLQGNADEIVPVLEDAQSSPESDGMKEVKFAKHHSDIVQIALLSEPHESPVYERALQIAQESKDYWLRSFHHHEDKVSEDVTWKVKQEGAQFDASPDGKIVAICHAGGITLRRTTNGEEILTLKGSSEVKCCTFDHSGCKLASLDEQSVISVWSLPSDLLKRNARKRKEDKAVIRPSHTFEVDFKVLMKLQFTGWTVVYKWITMRFSPSNDDVFVVSYDGKFLRCSLSENCVKQSPLRQVNAEDAAFSSDGTTMVVKSEDNHMTFYDITTLEPRLLSDQHVPDSPDCIFLANTRAPTEDVCVLAYWKSDRKTKSIFKYRNKKSETAFECDNRIHHVTVSSCGDLVAAATLEAVHIFRFEDNSRLSTLGKAAPGMALICEDQQARCHRHALLVSDYNTLSLCRIHEECEMERKEQGIGGVLTCWGSETGRSLIVFVNGCSQVQICGIDDKYDLPATLNVPCTSSPNNEDSAIAALALNNEGSLLALAVEKTIQLHKIFWSKTRSLLEKVELVVEWQEDSQVKCLCLLPAAGVLTERLVVISMAGTIKIRSLTKPKVVTEIGTLAFDDSFSRVQCIHLARSESLLTEKRNLLGDDNQIHIWSLSSKNVCKPVTLLCGTKGEHIQNVSVDCEEKYVAITIWQSLPEGKRTIIRKLDNTSKTKPLIELPGTENVSFHPKLPSLFACINAQFLVLQELRCEHKNECEDVMTVTRFADPTPRKWDGVLSWSADGRILVHRTDKFLQTYMVDLDRRHVVSRAPLITAVVRPMWRIKGCFIYSLVDLPPFAISCDAVLAVDKTSSLLRLTRRITAYEHDL